MLAEFGHFALILSLGMGLLLATVPLLAAWRGDRAGMAIAWPAASGQFLFGLVAFAALAATFLRDDFSVLYVAANSNTDLPTLFKIAAVWGAHEGSLLLWCVVLAGWTFFVSRSLKRLPIEFGARVLGVLGVVSVGVLLFTLFTSNPFIRLDQPPLNGRDLNPLLQDPALAIHPPMLYMGYVGTAVAFAFAVAVLLMGRLEREWARWARPWAVWSWMFLTVGIALGSWWAYYELGWGGWWFWDPVENASFMPWLVGTALIHSLATVDKRGAFKSWSLLLAIAAFSLSLLGTFLVRSGVIVSVHAFASDPARGVFILALLTIITGGALALYAYRAARFVDRQGFRLLSREAFLLGNNILLVAAAGAVLFGTLYPLFLDALGFGKISVGPPYFNAVFMIPSIPLIFLIGLGMHSAWQQTPWSVLKSRLAIPAALAVALTVVWLLLEPEFIAPLSIIGVLAALWIMSASLVEPLVRRARGEPFRPGAGYWGMLVAHFGLGMFVLGVTVTSTQGLEFDVSARPGETLTLGDYDVTFRSLERVEGPNYDAVQGSFEVTRGGQPVAMLSPQKRVYRVQKMPMTEAAIDAGLGRDLFLALGESLGDSAWSLRVQYKPLIRFIWLGALVMAIGGLIATCDRRYQAQPQTADKRDPGHPDAGEAGRESAAASGVGGHRPGAQAPA